MLTSLGSVGVSKCQSLSVIAGVPVSLVSVPSPRDALRITRMLGEEQQTRVLFRA